MTLFYWVKGSLAKGERKLSQTQCGIQDGILAQEGGISGKTGEIQIKSGVSLMVMHQG